MEKNDKKKDKGKSKSDSHLLESRGYCQVEPYKTIFNNTNITNMCVSYAPVTIGGACRICYQYLYSHSIDNNNLKTHPPKLITTQPIPVTLLNNNRDSTKLE